MAVSPSGVGLEAPGICAIACNKVRVRNCSGFSLAGFVFGDMAVLTTLKENGRDHTVPAVFRQKRYFVLVMAPAATAAVEPTAAPTTTAPTMSAAKAEAERNAGTIIRIGIRIGIIGRGRIVISRRRRRAIGISRPRRTIGIIARLLIFMHAAIISVGIISLDTARRVAGIVGADGGSRNQAGAGAGCGAQSGIAARRAQNGAQSRATQGAADRAASLFIPRGFTRGCVSGARRGIAAAKHVAVGLRLLRLGRGISLRAVGGR